MVFQTTSVSAAQGIVQHMRSSHPQTHSKFATSDIGGLEECYVQRFASGGQGGHSYFAVQSPHAIAIRSQAIAPNYLVHLRKALDSQITLHPSELDSRQVSPWNQTTGWLDYIHGRDPKELLALVAGPGKSSWFLLVDKVVTAYLNKAWGFVSQTLPLSLQLLNTDTMTSYVLNLALMYCVLILQSR